MAAINGCQEGKVTPKLEEVKCPACGEWMEVFVRMGDQGAGRLKDDEKCPACGHVIPEGTPLSELEQ